MGIQRMSSDSERESDREETESENHDASDASDASGDTDSEDAASESNAGSSAAPDSPVLLAPPPERSPLDIIKGISSDMDAISNRLGATSQAYHDPYYEPYSPGMEQVEGFQSKEEAPPQLQERSWDGGDNNDATGHMQQLHVIVDVIAGTAHVTGGDAAAVAGLEVLCHGRRMVVTTPSGEVNNNNRVALAESRRRVRAPVARQKAEESYALQEAPRPVLEVAKPSDYSAAF